MSKLVIHVLPFTKMTSTVKYIITLHTGYFYSICYMFVLANTSYVGATKSTLWKLIG